jgi:hypothetical protein
LKRLLVLLIAIPLLAQTPKIPAGMLPSPTMGATAAGRSYCGGGLAFISETTFQKLRRVFTGDSGAKAIVHVNFDKPCISANPGAKTVTWMWVMHIKDITNEADSISNLKTLNETATGMDIEGIRGHTIDWTVTTR